VSVPRFRKKVIGTIINNIDQGQMNTFLGVGDINGDGYPDIVVSGRNGKMVWFQNPGNEKQECWDLHLVNKVANQECGGSLYDLTGTGTLDIINGSAGGADKVTWWENPGSDYASLWKPREIISTGANQIHNTLVGDIKNDGNNYLLFANQGGGTRLFCLPLPEDPTVCPWQGVEIITEGKQVPNPLNPWSDSGLQPEEGLAIGDVDNDGKNEIICGTWWYKWTGSRWEEHKFASDDYMTTKVAIGDIDGDGKNEIVLSEGDAVCYGRESGGKLAWFKPGEDQTALWIEHKIDDGLLDAHSLVLADLCGNGRQDIFTAEIGRGDDATMTFVSRLPEVLIYENGGDGSFQKHVMDKGTGPHESVLIDMNGNGTLDIVGKPLWGPHKWDVIVWFNESCDENSERNSK